MKELAELEMEREELQKDLIAFKMALDTIRRRLIATSEERPERAESLNVWAGTWACIGSLELASQAIEKKLQEVVDLINRLRWVS